MSSEDRRRWFSVGDLVLVVTLLLQFAVLVFQLGEVRQQVTDINSRLIRVEHWIDSH